MKSIQYRILTTLLALWTLSAGIASALTPVLAYASYEEKDLHDKTVVVGFFVIACLIGGLIGTFVYFLPFLYAWKTKHPNTLVIFVINILTGWTVVGWVAAMIFATQKPTGGLQEKLKALDDLKNRGLITEQEYTASRSKLLF